MATNWNLLQMPDIGQAFQQGQEMRRQSDGRNALAAYAANPNEQSLNALSPYNPQFVVQTKRQDQQFQLEQQKLQQKSHGEQMQVLGKLIAPVKDEASYQQALAAARQGGLDVSTAPPSFDPAYIGRTKMLVDAYNKDGGKAISAAGQQALDLGYQRDTPGFAQVVAQILEAGQAKPYVVGGETRLYRPNFTPAPQQPQQATAQPQQILQNAAQTRTITPEEAATVRSSMNGPNGQAAFDNWMQSEGIAIAKTVNGQTFYQVNGQWYDNPEGQ